MVSEISHIIRLNILGDNNLGIFGFATEKFCLTGTIIGEKETKKMSNIFGVSVVKTRIYSTDLIGVFIAGNSNGIILPKIASDDEIKNLKQNLDCNIEVLGSKYSALGNLILANDKGAVISRKFTEKEREFIENCIGVKATFGTVAGTGLVGSGAICTNKGAVIHSNATENELKLIEKALHVKGDVGTANFGSPWLGSCLIANTKGLIISHETTPPEIMRLDEALGFLQ